MSDSAMARLTELVGAPRTRVRGTLTAPALTFPRPPSHTFRSPPRHGEQDVALQLASQCGPVPSSPSSPRPHRGQGERDHDYDYDPYSLTAHGEPSVQRLDASHPSLPYFTRGLPTALALHLLKHTSSPFHSPSNLPARTLTPLLGPLSKCDRFPFPTLLDDLISRLYQTLLCGFHAMHHRLSANCSSTAHSSPADY